MKRAIVLQYVEDIGTGDEHSHMFIGGDSACSVQVYTGEAELPKRVYAVIDMLDDREDISSDMYDQTRLEIALDLICELYLDNEFSKRVSTALEQSDQTEEQSC